MRAKWIRKAGWLKKATLAIAIAGLALSPIHTYAAEGDDIAGGESVIDSYDESKPTGNGNIGNAEVGVTWEYSPASFAIVYSIKITAGAMVFKYDFGDTWNPETHQYEIGESGSVDGGWNPENRKNGNNKITIQNNSNYPVMAKLTYAHELETTTENFFNKGAAAADPVKGWFSLTDSTDDNDYTIDGATTGIDEPIDMDDSAIKLQDHHHKYYTLKDESIPSTLDVYFAYKGKPDTRMQASDPVKSGKIKIVIYRIKFDNGTTVVENENNHDAGGGAGSP